MSNAQPIAIDDTDQVRPAVRLCHLMLREALAHGFATVELTVPDDGPPTARAEQAGEWSSFMAFPEAVYAALVEYLKIMAGVGEDDREAAANILVRVAGRDATIDLELKPDPRGNSTVVLRFPAASTA